MLVLGCDTEVPPPDAPTVVATPQNTPPPVYTPTMPPPSFTPTVSHTPIPMMHTDVRMQCSDSLPDASGIHDTSTILERREYALAPSSLPEGFEFAGTTDGLRFVNQLYENDRRIISIAYPFEFEPEGTFAMQTLGILRPPEAVDSLALADQTAHVLTGGWSDATILAGPGISPDKAEWDYERSLALFFKCKTDDGATIDVAVQALPSPSGWINIEDLVDIGQSLRRISAQPQP